MSVSDIVVQGRHLHLGMRLVEGHIDGYGTFILPDTQNLSMQSPEESVLSGSALSMCLEQMTPEGPSQSK